MTLNDLKKREDVFLTPAVVAQVIGCDPQYIRVAARQHPEQLGFPVTLIGNRVKIPRLAFIRYVEGGERDTSEDWFRIGG